VADGGPAEQSGLLEPWEIALVHTVTAAIRTAERDDLESDLAIHLLRIKARWAGKARNWRAFAATALRNKAKNWIRDRQVAERKFASLDDVQDEQPRRESLERSARESIDQDVCIAVRAVWDRLDESLKRCWNVLLEENGNQIRAAQRLGVHRNTVRLWIGRIRNELQRHGFEPTQ
jgi:RNA polymerase sigma factor (sigma-70 family)